MKTYQWSVHDREGTLTNHGQITVARDTRITQTVKLIQSENDIQIDDYLEFRLKQIV